MEQTKTYTGIDLLNKIFEFIEVTPDPGKWNLKSLKDNPPRYIRLQQIEALLSAFFEKKEPTGFLEKTKTFFTGSFKATIETILSGEFIKERTTENYAELIAFMKNTIEEKEPTKDTTIDINVAKLVTPFKQLAKYKRQAMYLLTLNSGWLEAGSFTSRFSIYLTNSVSSTLADKFATLDKALELFINPQHLSFTEEELKAKFGFPLNKPTDIDMDFI